MVMDMNKFLKISGWTGAGVGVVGIGLVVAISFYVVKQNVEFKAKQSNPNFPQLSIERNLNEVQKTDGKVERIIKTAKGIEYVLRDCDSRFNPKPNEIDGPYNPRNIEIICTYDLEGERSYIGALERAEEIYDEEMKQGERKIK